MEENSTDRFFRDTLQDHSISPSDSVWESLSERLDESQMAGFFSRNAKWLVLLLIFLSVGVGGLLVHRVYELEVQVGQLHQEIQEQDLSTESVTTSTSRGEAESNVGLTNEEDLSRSIAVQEAKTSGIGNESEEVETQAVTTIPDSEKGAIKERGIAIEFKEKELAEVNEGPHGNSEESSERYEAKHSDNYEVDVRDQKDTQSRLPEEETLTSTSGEAETETPFTSDISLEKLALLPPGIEPVLTKELLIDTADIRDAAFRAQKWWFGLSMGYNTTFRRLKSTGRNAEGRAALLNDAERPGSTYGLNLHLAYQFSPHIRIRTGLEYAQWKQNGAYEMFIQRGDGTVSDVTTGLSQWTFDSALETSSGLDEVIFQGQSNPAETIFVTTASDSIVSIPVSVKETIDWLSLPLILEYQSSGERLGVFLGAGLSYDLLLRSRSDLSFQQEGLSSSVTPGAIEKSGYVSAILQAGLSYHLTDKIRLSLSPRYKSWLIPIYDSGALQSRPYSGSVMTGIEFQLR